MEQTNKKLITPLGVVFDVILTAIFFVFMLGVCRPHVPIETEPTNTILAALTALPIACVFFVALQCFRVTLVDQLNRKREHKKL